MIERALELWMDGQPLTDIQSVFPVSVADRKKSLAARKFVLRLLPNLAHLCSSLARIVEMDSGDDSPDVPPSVTTLGRCVRKGLSSVEMYALSEHFRSGSVSRREVHRRFESIKGSLTPATINESWAEVKGRVERAWVVGKAVDGDEALG